MPDPTVNNITVLNKSAPSHIVSWLKYTKCITQYCKEFGLSYNLKLLEQYLKEDKQIFIRKTISFIEDKPAILAETTLNYSAYQEFKNILDNLNNKPIGENLLFTKHSIREPFKYSMLTPENHEYDDTLHQYTNDTKTIFKRTSIFRVREHKINLQEHFLPTITKNSPQC